MKLSEEVKSIITGYGTNEHKKELLETKLEEIKIAIDIIDGKFGYCEDCDDYYLEKSFLTEEHSEHCKVCTYEDPINSGGNEYTDGIAIITERICPKGHRKVINRIERKA